MISWTSNEGKRGVIPKRPTKEGGEEPYEAV
jgi:hypothetical protein